MKFSKMFFILSLVLCFTACNKDNDVSPTTETPTTETPTNTSIDEGDDPNFKIVANNDGTLNSFTRKVVVFGVDIYAVPGVTDAKLLHAANLLAQYLDNDEDGTIDNQLVLDKMLENKAFMVMWKGENDLDIDIPNGRIGQDLGNDETIPAWHTNGQTGRFDAAIEEVWHIVTHAGYESAYPSVFGTQQGSQISNAMDIARGGAFQSPPSSYPTDAWYTYDDTTCDYECQGGEYIYWGMSSILGAQSKRLSEIDNEWRLNTKEKIQEKDGALYQLLTDTQYKFPTVLPDGTYRR